MRHLDQLRQKDAVIARQAEMLRDADAKIADLRIQLEAAVVCADPDAQVVALRRLLAEETERTERALTLAEEWQKQAETLLDVVRGITRALTNA